jgi:hypothetical protein
MLLKILKNFIELSNIQIAKIFPKTVPYVWELREISSHLVVNP